ncbi:MAG TPA: hypothetical protein PKX27_02825 [Bacteroidales bacterium]|jgi:hypothetical protein|nr:hypothetical protein [Bacteroidales bacterium]HOX73470.1 hypothetical protein [Bacteroidales bacterium]HPM86893.1 hypothetical protein [Bacteroidales bacterium]HQM68826.1 hypothetical protein [Bacteroidales bacterium]
MTFDNTKQIISIRIRLFIATVLILAYLAVTYLIGRIKFPVLGLSETAWTIILIAIYLIIFFIPIMLNHQFISYSDDDENIVIKYFNAGIGGGKKNSIKIYKTAFAGYKTESRLFGLDKSLILYQKVGQNVAKYPPVHISALSKEQRNKLIKSLNDHIPAI